jgi:hypothetical protein
VTERLLLILTIVGFVVPNVLFLLMRERAIHGAQAT